MTFTRFHHSDNQVQEVIETGVDVGSNPILSLKFMSEVGLTLIEFRSLRIIVVVEDKVYLSPRSETQFQGKQRNTRKGHQGTGIRDILPLLSYLESSSEFHTYKRNYSFSRSEDLPIS